MNGASPLGVCVLPEPGPNAPRTVQYAGYIEEVLAHAGICHRTIPFGELESTLPEVRLLLTVGDTLFPASMRDSMRAWLEAGGAWVSVGGTCGMEALLGVECEPPAFSLWPTTAALGQGYLALEETSHPIVAGLPLPLHYFNGIAVRARQANVLATALDAHQRPTDRALLTERLVGYGRCLLIAPDVTGTLVRIQQGLAITRDGVPAPDGTAPLCDQVLKSDDGTVLDWHFDRGPVPDATGLSCFLQPVADLWREMLVRTLFHAARTQGVVLPVLWLYPRDLPALGHLSHDTDGNDEERARRLLAVLDELQVQSTWCVIAPGYPRELIDEIARAGHEPAMHYDAMSEGHGWGEEAFEAQWQALKALFAGLSLRSNKNHYLRWEGDTEFFRWCERRGIELDQSKGPSKPGVVGFPFGTCHPYRPVDPGGEWIDVLELPTLTQDLCVFAPPAVLGPLLDAARDRHGVLHLLFHPAHVDKPGVADSLATAVRAGRAAGLEWWTAERINRWERARRKADWEDYDNGGDTTRVTLRAAQSLPEATLLWPAVGESRLFVNGRETPATDHDRWGFPVRTAVLAGEAQEAYRLEWRR